MKCAEFLRKLSAIHRDLADKVESDELADTGVKAEFIKLQRHWAYCLDIGAFLIENCSEDMLKEICNGDTGN
jgi:hypothetical protein